MATSDTNPTGDYGAAPNNRLKRPDDVPTVVATGSSIDDVSVKSSVDNSMATTFDALSTLSESTHDDTHKDRYERHVILGEGGFGRVFKGIDRKFGRPVAIKVARSDRNKDPQSYARFQAEAVAAGKLNHPNIVQVYEYGVDQFNIPFIVFEFIDGQSLVKRLDKESTPDAYQPLQRDEVISIMATVAEAIHDAHKKGVIHRDLKPANILLDKESQPHIVDFGLAVDDESQRDQKGVVAGSWFYMSPEQVRGETQYLDGRTDIWSLGVILYELLAGRRPFTGAKLADVQDEILRREPKPLRQVDDSIPVALEQVCFRCLSKDVKSRYSSAADVAKALRACRKTGSPSLTIRIFAITVSVVLIATMLAYAVYHFPQTDPTKEDPRVAGQSNDAKRPPENKNDTQVEEVQPVVGPTPGKWFPLLRNAQSVKPFAWPADNRNSHWQVFPDEEKIWVSCGGRGLIKLGEVHGSDYRFELNLHQVRWMGATGIFFGAHPAEYNGVKCRKLQVINLSCEPTRRLSPNELERNILYLDERAGQVHNSSIAGAGVSDLSSQDQTLAIFVQNGVLNSVLWNREAKRELVTPEVSSRLKDGDCDGDFGVYVLNATAVFRRPEFLLIQNGPNE